MSNNHMTRTERTEEEKEETTTSEKEEEEAAQGAKATPLQPQPQDPPLWHSAAAAQPQVSVGQEEGEEEEEGEAYCLGSLEWPVTRDSGGGGGSSATATTQRVWMAALQSLWQSCSPDEPQWEMAQCWLDQCHFIFSENKKRWRHGYLPLLHYGGRIMATATPTQALALCRGGLDALHHLLVVPVYQKSHASLTIAKWITARDAVLGPNDDDVAQTLVSLDTLHTRVLYPPPGAAASSSSSREPPAPLLYELAAPVSSCEEGGERSGSGRDVLLSGENMVQQLDRWVQYGCMEPSAGRAGAWVARCDNATRLVQDYVFGLLLWGGDMTFAETLLTVGATVWAVARPGTSLQQWMQRVANGREQGSNNKNDDKKTATPPGPPPLAIHPQAQLVMPALPPEKDNDNDEAKPGADLLRHAPQVARWLVRQVQSSTTRKKLVLCPLAQVDGDGERHVRLVVAMDLIVEYVCQHCPDTIVSYVLSPLTVHAVPEEAVRDAQRRYDGASFLSKTWRSLSLQPSFVWEDEAQLPHYGLRIWNGLAQLQGPHAALAQTVPHWRAMLLRHRRRDRVVAQYGPWHDSRRAVAWHGVPSLEPLVVFSKRSASTLATALLLYQLHHSSEEEEEGGEHPLSWFQAGAVHGGVWRCPYTMDSLCSASYLWGKVNVSQGWLFATKSPSAAAAAAVVQPPHTTPAETTKLPND